MYSAFGCKNMINYDKFSVEELISAVKSGDDDACAELLRRYAPLIDSSVIGAVSLLSDASRTDEEEFRQEAIIKLYQSALRYDSANEDVSFGLYAKICIKNRMISLIRRHSGVFTVDDDSFDPEDGISLDPDPSETLLNMESEKELDVKIKAVLSPLEYEVYDLYVDGAKPSTISDALGVSVKTVENALYRMRAKLQKLISQ